MNSLAVYLNKDFGKVRTIHQDKTVFFLANDIATCLGYKSPKDAIARHCKSATMLEYQTEGGAQNAKFILRNDIFRLVLKSKISSDVAEKFEAWILDEVLPSLAETGSYTVRLTREQQLAEAVLLAQDVIKEKDLVISLQQTQIQVLKPKAEIAEIITQVKDGILVGEFAKVLANEGFKIGQNRLFALLREKGYLIKRHGSSYNLPTQFSAEKQIIDFRENMRHNSNNEIVFTKTPMITGKGQVYFLNLFKKGILTI